MGSTEYWVIEQNLERFLDRLEKDEGMGNSLVISKLLVTEVSKLGQHATSSDCLGDHIVRCELLIGRLRAKLRESGAVAQSGAEEALSNLIQIKDVLATVRECSSRDEGGREKS